MDNRSLDKALDIAAKLIQGEEIGREKNFSLYEEYNTNPEVYEILSELLKKWNLSLYEYQDTLYISPGENNRVFGYSNEELKKELGIRLNRELYLCYFIMYIILMRFYADTGSYNYTEYIRIPDVVAAADASLKNIMDSLQLFVKEEVEEESFKAVAMVWADLPVSAKDEQQIRAVKTTRSGFVKLVLNFMVEQQLLSEAQERYYPKKRLQALAENYFEENKGRLYEIMKGRGEKDAAY